MSRKYRVNISFTIEIDDSHEIKGEEDLIDLVNEGLLNPNFCEVHSISEDTIEATEVK